MHASYSESRERPPLSSLSSTNPLPKVHFIGFVTGLCGDAIQMMELAHGIQQLGHPIQLIVPDMPSTRNYADRCSALHVPVALSPLINADQMGNTDQSVINILKLLHSVRHTTVHFHTGDLVLPRKALLGIQLTKMYRVIVTVHNPYDYLDPKSSRARLWVSTVKRCIHTVVCPSEHSYKIQRRIGVPESKLVVIRNGVDMNHYGSGNPDVVRRNALNFLPEQAQIILHTARMEAGKRPGDALEAFLRIAPGFPLAHLVFAGTGDLWEALTHRVPPQFKNRVHFVGFQTNVADWLAAATIWVHASEGENFSAALLQALAARLPIVASMCSGNNEVLLPDKNALTFMPGEVDVLASALQRLLSDARLRATLGAEAERTAKMHSFQNMVNLYSSRCYQMN
jgi:glycosyltransferase involved in cell wall biosynthesis